ncbi:acetate--CoA ligase family protein [Sphingomicrobium sp. XHP0239]|uniref:ATP-binding protein n=1 Tax=Sphingomicrobium maritimum TaxID=3133972 RepID=UPI0031CCCE5A
MKVRVIGSPLRIEGFAFGLRCASVRISLSAETIDPRRCRRIGKELNELLGERQATRSVDLPPAPSDAGAPAFGRWFAKTIDFLLACADLAFTDPCRVVSGGERLSVFIPSFRRGSGAVRALVEILVARLNADALDPTMHERLEKVLAALRDTQPATTNGPRFARAAFDLGIPFQELVGPTAQFGIGRHAVELSGTFSQVTPRNATAHAKLKHYASTLLARALLPAPAFALCSSADEAERNAEAIGYPVVVKPADRDGGKGVEAGLRDASEVRDAFAAAAEVSRTVMVEKHVEGRDYRLTVFRGETIWAVERRPAGVMGNGQSSVLELVAALNAEPGRGDDTHSRLKRISLGEREGSLLAVQDLSPDSIPEDGRFVRLARKSNVTAGGTPIAVTEDMHPDNAALAARAAEVLHLDIAGVDLILPDISRSWRETGGAICEVNANPELGGTTSLHLYPWLLQRLVPRGGHVPTIALLDGPSTGKASLDLADRLNSEAHPCGLHCADGVRVGTEWVERGALPTLVAGQCLTFDQRVASLVLGALDLTVTMTGLPVPQVDLLVLTGERPTGEGGAALSDGQLLLLLATIRPHCGDIRLLDAGDCDPGVRRVLERMRIDASPISMDEIVTKKRIEIESRS